MTIKRTRVATRSGEGSWREGVVLIEDNGERGDVGLPAGVDDNLGQESKEDELQADDHRQNAETEEGAVTDPLSEEPADNQIRQNGETCQAQQDTETSKEVKRP
jgi:hypothetical protein